MKKIREIIRYIVSIPRRIHDSVVEAVDAGVVDFSGQGRDKYGR